MNDYDSIVNAFEPSLCNLNNTEPYNMRIYGELRYRNITFYIIIINILNKIQDT